MAVSSPTQSRYGQDFPLDNLTYDLITIIQEKSKGLEAYSEYLQDAQGENEVSNLLQQIQQQDAQYIRQLQQILAKRIGR